MATLDPKLQSAIDGYFAAMNDRDEAAFAAGLAEGIVFFGSMAGVPIRGIDAMRGMFQALGLRFPGLQQVPGRTFGGAREVAVLVELTYAGDTGQGIWIFRFDGAGRIERVSAIYDPQPFQLKRVRGGTLPGVRLEEAFPPAALDPALLQALDAYFSTFNAGDEVGHMRLFDPDVAFFGSMSRIDSFGHATVRGVFHAARTSMGVHHLSPSKTYGRRHELAVLVSFTAEDSAVPPAEGVWAFRFNEKGLIDRLSILWNPAYFPKG